MIRISLPQQLEPDNIRSTHVAIKAANADESIKVILLQGQSDIFCLGMSFNYLANNTSTEVDQAIDLFIALIREIYFSKKPILAIVQGKALAGGAGLAAACDFVVADYQAIFGFSEALFGLLPGIILPFLLQRMSLQKAKQLILSADTISADSALTYGLVDELVSTDQFEIFLQKKIKILSRIDSQIVIRAKELIAKSIDFQLDSALQRGRILLKQALTDAQVLDNIRHYAEYGIIPWGNRVYDSN